ncbi:hypothetical protein RvY_00663-2 [Ramazzottius varieornatus]|uniref:Uncharacterized protein n=1 Tax=Ramazzottius varieornatus TaxID=947166 RepID=A0A1D1UND3_RAMVA|nr:hypothetical protein RvY_00663-2 [Ramazzottius varieornatus]
MPFPDSSPHPGRASSGGCRAETRGDQSTQESTSEEGPSPLQEPDGRGLHRALPGMGAIKADDAAAGPRSSLDQVDSGQNPGELNTLPFIEDPWAEKSSQVLPFVLSVSLPSGFRKAGSCFLKYYGTSSEILRCIRTSKYKRCLFSHAPYDSSSLFPFCSWKFLFRVQLGGFPVRKSKVNNRGRMRASLEYGRLVAGLLPPHCSSRGSEMRWLRPRGSLWLLERIGGRVAMDSLPGQFHFA